MFVNSVRVLKSKTRNMLSSIAIALRCVSRTEDTKTYLLTLSSLCIHFARLQSTDYIPFLFLSELVSLMLVDEVSPAAGPFYKSVNHQQPMSQDLGPCSEVNHQGAKEAKRKTNDATVCMPQRVFKGRDQHCRGHWNPKKPPAPDLHRRWTQTQDELYEHRIIRKPRKGRWNLASKIRTLIPNKREGITIH
eukprot:1152357-Pelagomonas_calceolata.AAC.1